MGNLEVLIGLLTAVALGQSLLTASMLMTSETPIDVRVPLILFFFANAVTEMASLAYSFDFSAPTLRHAMILSSLPATLLLAPTIWLYLRTLTSEEPVRFRRSQLLHFVPAVLGVLVCIAMGIVSEDVREQIFGDLPRTDAPVVIFATLLVLSIILINMGQLLGYIIPISQRLWIYRQRLRDLYANTEKRDLLWVVWMLGLLLINVIWALYSTFFDSTESHELIGEIANVALIWVLSVCGLKQQPGLRAEAMAAQPELADGADDPNEEKSKYEKSALSEEQIDRISESVELAMQADQLYLNPNLSLRHLASHISTYPNYVSQTLNGRLGTTFFDYINGWRIRDAMPRLADSDEQVTNIAYDVGFNSRSSFYNAFKKETGETPTQYRQRSRQVTEQTN
ncbi:MAG: AraC family transcriptional regulator [Pseudomonadota bacterium]